MVVRQQTAAPAAPPAPARRCRCLRCPRCGPPPRRGPRHHGGDTGPVPRDAGYWPGHRTRPRGDRSSAEARQTPRVYCQNVSEELAAWSPKRSKGWILPNDTGVVLEDGEDHEEEAPGGTLRGPDVQFISRERIAASGEPMPSDDWLRTPPELAVEVKSPSESWPETRRKAAEYLNAGVGEVWVLDGPTRQLRVHRGASEDPLVLGESDDLTSPQLPGFACKVADLLAVNGPPADVNGSAAGRFPWETSATDAPPPCPPPSPTPPTRASRPSRPKFTPGTASPSRTGCSWTSGSTC